MTMVNLDGEDYRRAKCDAAGCEELAPAPGVYLAGQPPGTAWPGWVNLGWRCTGGTHLCPKHNPDNEG
jgi:hypothetical protein